MCAEAAADHRAEGGMAQCQRAFATQEGGAVLDGRDIGTVIAPDANVKLFVTASVTARAERRWLEMAGREIDLPRDEIERDIAARDARDIQRKDSPLRAADGGLTGPIAIGSIRSFKFDRAIIGCSAIDGDGDVLDYDIAEVGVSRAIIEQARHVTLVADHSKFSRNAPARITALSDVDCLITDRPLPPALAAPR